MKMQTKIFRDEIQQMTKIQLHQDDIIEKGSYANVYRYQINNTMLAVKCFLDQNKAVEENALLQKIYSLIPNCPGIIQYYQIQQLEIEIIGAFSGSYKGYAIFFEACLLDFQKLFGIVQKLQIKEVFNLQTIVQLIRFFNQPMFYIQKYIPSFKSDILKNPILSTIILAFFEEQSIQLSRIHAQFNIQPFKFNCKAFHQDCDNKGSTLVIMHSNKESNSFFGGMAASQWNSGDRYIADPIGECSWLFKIEVEESMIHLHQWKCIKQVKAILGNPSCGPAFGLAKGGYNQATLYTGYYYGISELPSNNKYYEKINLNSNTIFQLRNQINCSQKVQRSIMSEEEVRFQIDSCEAFQIKK